MMPAKRERDEDLDSDLDGERGGKKPRPPYNHHLHSTLAWNRPSFAPSPSTSFANNLPITPTQSVCGAAAYASAPSVAGHALHYPSSGMDVDTVMDEYDIEPSIQLPVSPVIEDSQNVMRLARLRPSPSHLDNINHTGRVSTPMHPTFKRGGLNRSHAMNTPCEAIHENSGLLYPHVPSMSLPPARKPLAHETDGDDDEGNNNNNGSRRMFSPICEDEDIPDIPTELTQSQLSRLSFSNTTPTDDMETEPRPAPALGLTPVPRGRKRSGALTGVARFTMGYREDCEKCRQQTPGHYSHFLT